MKCEICNKVFETLKSIECHARQCHNIRKEEYYLKYINSQRGACKLCNNTTRFISLTKGYARCCSIKCAKLLDSQSPTYRKKISITTQMAMQRDDVKQNHLLAVSKPKSDDTRKKLSYAAKQKFVNDPSLKTKIYTEKRNTKISKSKIEFWKHNPDAKRRVGNIWRLWKERDEVGWRKHLLKASRKGFEKIFAPLGDTKLETRLYSMLENENIKYVKKYELCGKIYDAYLPDYNVIIEIDGEFWHRSSLEECQYQFQIESYHNDKLKEEIAKNNGIRLLRIKEFQIPNTISEIL